MRNIILFIRHYFNLFLFIILIGLCITILVNFNKSYEGAFANSANEITGWIDKQYNNVEYYFLLKNTNERLAEENARLLNAMPESFLSPDSTMLSKVDSSIRDSSGRVRRFNYLPAKVINNSITDQNNYITLYRGTNQGVKKEMGVVGPDGVVGKVILVSENYSRVMSLLNRYSKVSAMLKNNNHTGLIDWDGENPELLILHSIPKSVKVRKGDTVLTSNLSGNFPEGLIIGTVSRVTTESSSNFYTIEVKAATNFYNIQYVYLIENMLWKEQEQLEALTPKN